MKILLSVHHHLSGDAGAPGVTLRLADQYRKAGHQVTLASFDELPRWIPERAAQVVYPWFVATAATRKTTSFDVIDASTGDTWLLGALPSRTLPAVIVRSHGLEHTAHLERRDEARRGHLKLSRRYAFYHGGWRLREVAWSLRHADLALFLNVGDRDYAVSRLGVSLDRTVIVDNGLPDAFLGLDGPSPHDIPHIAAIGSFLEGKGTRYLVPALIRLLERHPRLRAGFFGVGVPAEDVLHRFPVQLRSRLEVVEHYSNEALPILLRDYSIQLMPSLAEGFGVAGLEGMACGLALVTTVCSGLAERLVDGEDAVLIPPGSVSAIDTAVQRLLEDADLLARMRRAGQAKAQYFSWNRVGRDNLELYQEVLERKLARRA